MADEIFVVFENAPGPEPARFMEVENAVTGKSVEIAWHNWGERWELGPFVKHEDTVALEAKVSHLEALLARAYPWLHNPYRADDGTAFDYALAQEGDAIIRDVEVAIQHLPDDTEY